ncbi:MAG: hypothetical protein GFH27_549413n2 [Chloroflexi bacterium AL-W]|nr:hypothetical protein [Chloroflexi bacterium AL-N1]NOK71400.1 hypothetical protein [Chloroflexi bacterium AL-N10]NOK78803.1 hypothetical protein [Chloroflexi bacterium AL-N5]NOK86221.1 hypothetical protein [Chloroflexi bacterium AL-W]NOK93125.1 hypothetical protein [Chloroflexi bacterium AL-N15]
MYSLVHQRSTIHILWVIITIAAVVVPTWLVHTRSASADSRTFHVDCQGNDSASGTAPGSAWRSLEKANQAPLGPGDKLLFKRGCTWEGGLTANWRGASEEPIIIGAYGEGILPQISGDRVAVSITGQYQIIEYLDVTAKKPQPYNGAVQCADQPTGWRSGFAFNEGSQYNTVQHSRATGVVAGIHFSSGSHNRALYNELTNNNVMSRNTPNGGDDDSGAWGVLLNSDHNEVAYNTFSDNRACSEDYGVEGASIEVYRGSHNYIHHNTSVNDTTFTELGGTPSDQAENNIYAYNLYAPVNSPTGIFLVVRGANSKWGGNPGTQFHNNTGYWVDIGISCGSGCNENILRAHNNIVWSRDDARRGALFADAPFDERNNIFWKSDGNPRVQIEGGTRHETTITADPLFVDAQAYDFRLRPGSPAIGAATNRTPGELGINQDIIGVTVPLDVCADVGAFEHDKTTNITEAIITNTDDALALAIDGEHMIYLPMIMRTAPCFQ